MNGDTSLGLDDDINGSVFLKAVEIDPVLLDEIIAVFELDRLSMELKGWELADGLMVRVSIVIIEVDLLLIVAGGVPLSMPPQTQYAIPVRMLSG